MSVKDIIKLVFSLLALSIGGYFFYKQNKVEDYLKEHGVTTNAILHTVGSKDVYYQYEVNGKIYKVRTSRPYPEMTTGEMFKLKYNAENPREKQIFFSYPVFPEEANIDSSYAERFSIPISLNPTEVKYFYKVGDEEYERWQKAPSKNIDLRRHYIVKYRVDRPEIGYIFFDEQ